MRTCRFITFGCKANQVDTQRLRELLQRHGWSESEDAAELLVVNTCTVTAEAGAKARKLVRRLQRENPGARIVLTGCLAEADPRALAELEGVAAVIGNRERESAPLFLRASGISAPVEELALPPGIAAFAGHTRAFLKIQDGCDRACAYCIVPSVRGRSRSRAPGELLAEAATLVAAGHRELVLCGIHIGAYGLDRGTTLAELLRHMADLAGDFRVRLSSIEATEVSAELLRTMAESKRFCHHLHLPLQSGDDEVLRAMNRWYDCAEYLRALERIRTHLDRPAITGDVIVGFPGEGEAHFANTLATARAAGFCRLHVFPFSARPGTAAEDLPGRVASAELRERRTRLTELVRETAQSYHQTLLGRTDRVVFEDPRSGLTDRYQRFTTSNVTTSDVTTPDVTTQESAADLSGQMRAVRIERLAPEGLCGSIRDHGTREHPPTGSR